MNIGIIGTGRLAISLGRRWISQGHAVVFGSTDPHRAAELAGEMGFLAAGGTIMQAAQFGSIVVLATPFHRIDEVLRRAGPMNQKTVIDCTTPLHADLSPIVGLESSGAEYIAALIPGAYVVKAFYDLRMDALEQDADATPTITYCGDVISAKEKTARLINDAGFIPADAGTLDSARHLEPLAVQQLLLGRNHADYGDSTLNLMRWLS